VDSFTHAPLLQKRNGTELVDHNNVDGLLCGLRGTSPVQQAIQWMRSHEYSRDDLDAYAVESHERACRAWQSGIYEQVLPMENLERDECVREGATLEGFKKAPGLFGQNVLAVSNVTSPCDGASFIVGSTCQTDFPRHTPRVKVVDYAFSYCSPSLLFPAALGAIHKVLSRLLDSGVDPKRIYYEISDPFALVGLYYKNGFQLSAHQMNIFGGTLSLGHPSGVTGMRMIQNAMLVLEKFPFQFHYAIVATPSISGEGCTLVLKSCTNK
jgi:acetyl-CoA C-acetyltransferase